MKGKPKKVLSLCIIIAIAVLIIVSYASPTGSGADEYQSSFYATGWSLVPPVVAIVLALITKEVYSSLFIGILAGGLFYADFNPVRAVISVVEMMIEKISDNWNAGILIFLILLGMLVCVMNAAGGSRAYGAWAGSRIKSKRGALLSTFGLGVLIFVDDYFNCLTVGSVMLPVTDKHKISRAKLAYLIDATAAPICIIAPISSWAAAVTSSTEGSGLDGFLIFLRAIPYNFYALLTIVMVVAMCFMKFDFASMKRHERLAEKGDLFGGTGNEYAGEEQEKTGEKGKVIDLLLPVIMLIAFCIIGMVYTGGFFEGVPFIEAFANCDASVGLAIGSIAAVIFAFALYIPRDVVSFKDFSGSLPKGFKQMVPAILILSFAWTLSGFCKESLGADEFVRALIGDNATAGLFLPGLMFLVALGLAFATGTSWGTFGILIPIALAIFPEMNETLIITVSACLAGAVCGDHISPISDTTIMASTGAQCNHIAHVSTQIPYAMVVAAVSFVGYVLAGAIKNPYIVLAIGCVILLGTLFAIKTFTKDKHPGA